MEVNCIPKLFNALVLSFVVSSCTSWEPPRDQVLTLREANANDFPKFPFEASQIVLQRCIDGNISLVGGSLRAPLKLSKRATFIFRESLLRKGSNGLVAAKNTVVYKSAKNEFGILNSSHLCILDTRNNEYSFIVSFAIGNDKLSGDAISGITDRVYSYFENSN